MLRCDATTLGPSGGGSSGGSGSSSSSSSSSGAASSTSSSGATSSGATSSGGTTTSSSGATSSGATSSGGTDAGSVKDTGAPDTAPVDPMTAARTACVQKINDYRATLQLPPLTQYFAKEVCTDGEAKSDGMSGTAHGAFGTCGETAQNECPGWPGPPATLIVDCLAQMWAEGPGGGHYENMRTTSRTKVSCGFYQTTKGDWWAAQNFY